MRLKAPDLLLDLLGTNEQPVPTQVLIQAGRLIGIGDVAIRVALGRLVVDGKIERHARASYRARRPAGVARAVTNWRDKHFVMGPWEAGQWIAIQDAGVARAEKIVWRRHQLAMDLWGFRQLRAGLHVRPANLRLSVDELRAQMTDVGLSPSAFAFHVSALPKEIEIQARGLWRVEEIVATDTALLKRLRASLPRLARSTLDHAVVESFVLGREVIEYLVRDPLLPSELMKSALRLQLLEAARRYQDHGKNLWRQWIAERLSGAR